MSEMQRPVRQNVKTIPSDEVMGKGSWVKIRAMSVADHTEYQSLIRGSQQLAQSKESTPDDFQKNENRLREIIVGCVLEWNWVDDEGHDMPQPHNNPVVIEQMTNEEVTFLMEAILTGKSSDAKKKEAELEVIYQYLTVGNLVDPATGQTRELPWAWTELRLCRDVYHCTPEELDRQDWTRIQQHIAIMNLEAEAEALRRQHTSKK